MARRATTAAAPWVCNVVRVGYLAKGLIYTLIGSLALRVAFGLRGGRLTDPTGVLRTLLLQPFGLMMLTVIGIGIVGYSLYYFFEAIADLKHKGGGVGGWTDRTLTMIKAGAYGTIGIQALGMVFLNRQPSSDTEQSARAVMAWPFGDVLLVLVGIGIAVYGFTQMRMVVKGFKDEDLDQARVRREAPWVLRLGRFGTAARSIILLSMGGTMTWAGWRNHPADADGYSESLSAIASFNPWLLGAIGAGLLSFGLYQLCHVRYARLADAR